MPRQIYMDDRLVPEAEAVVSVFDHGLLYGDGVFEGLRVYSGRVFRMREHLDRLAESARAIRLELPKSLDDIAAATDETVAANDIADGYVRLVVTRGVGTLGLGIDGTSNPKLIIIAADITLYPQKYYDEGLPLVTASTIRNHPQALSPRIKSLNYLNNIMARIEGCDAGSVEALMLNHKGEVAECTGDNIFILKNGLLWTPPLEAGILDGITRRVVLELATATGLPTREAPMTRHDIYTADECFLTGSAAEIVPVVSLDGRAIGDGKPGPTTKDLLERFRAETIRQS
ncbi:MAG: branched-chain-amino-acid transaminase [Planctomycetota bacterium]